jgi:hypothetical protein
MLGSSLGLGSSAKTSPETESGSKLTSKLLSYPMFESTSSSSLSQSREEKFCSRSKSSLELGLLSGYILAQSCGP